MVIQQNKIKVFIPHRWSYEDYAKIYELLDRTKYEISDKSVPETAPLDFIDKRYNVDPQIQRRIKRADVVVCSNRPANNNGMSIDEIKFAVDNHKPIVAIRITDSNSSYISEFGIQVIACRKDSLESWINENVKQCSCDQSKTLRPSKRRAVFIHRDVKKLCKILVSGSDSQKK